MQLVIQAKLGGHVARFDQVPITGISRTILVMRLLTVTLLFPFAEALRFGIPRPNVKGRLLLLDTVKWISTPHTVWLSLLSNGSCKFLELFSHLSHLLSRSNRDLIFRVEVPQPQRQVFPAPELFSYLRELAWLKESIPLNW